MVITLYLEGWFRLMTKLNSEFKQISLMAKFLNQVTL